MANAAMVARLPSSLSGRVDHCQSVRLTAVSSYILRLPCLPKSHACSRSDSLFLSCKRDVVVRAEQQPSSSPVPDASPSQVLEAKKQELFSLLDFFRGVADSYILQPLGNFGFGKKSMMEGGVGLFMIAGAFAMALLISWIKGVAVRSGTSRYQATIEFSQACGITVGTPVRIRGVDIGSVVGVQPSLERIDTIVQISDSRVIIPRNSLIEVNQSGLISETLIDITPLPPMPTPTVGPLDPKCSEEGVIVCDRERIAGQQGVSLDELIANWTKIAKDVDREGIDTMFQAMDKFAALAEEAKPLVEKVNSMAEDIVPLLKDVKDGELLRNLEQLTKVASEAAADLRSLNNAILTSDNTELLRQSVADLTRTLKHIERISADVSSLTGDPSTRFNLKQIIESLSRLVVD